MDWSHLGFIGIVVLGGLGAALLRRRRHARLTLTAQTVRCPIHPDYVATLAVSTDADAHPGYRYVDVAACSLLPATSFVPPVRTAYVPDVLPFGPYVREASQMPCHSPGVACPRQCLHTLNAAERAGAQPITCASGVSDGLDLARQTQSPAMMRQLWFHSF